MCDPRQGSTLTGRPRNAICRVTCRLRTYAGGSATFLNHLRTRTPTHAQTRTPRTPHALGHTTHTRTHPRQAGRTAQAGRRTWLRHIFPPRNGLFIKWNKAERARLAPGTSTPPPAAALPPPLRGQIRSTARLSSSLVARSPSLARSFIAHGQKAPSPIINAAACRTTVSRATTFQGCSLWAAHKLNGCPGPSSIPTLETLLPSCNQKD